jgi:hypothetical protein
MLAEGDNDVLVVGECIFRPRHTVGSYAASRPGPRREKPRGSRNPLGVFSMRTVLRLPAHLPAETGWRVVPVDSGPQTGPGCSLRSRCDPLPRNIQVVLPRALSDSEPTPRGRLSPVRSPASFDVGEGIRCRDQLPLI